MKGRDMIISFSLSCCCPHVVFRLFNELIFFTGVYPVSKLLQMRYPIPWMNSRGVLSIIKWLLCTESHQNFLFLSFLKIFLTIEFFCSLKDRISEISLARLELPKFRRCTVPIPSHCRIFLRIRVQSKPTIQSLQNLKDIRCQEEHNLKYKFLTNILRIIFRATCCTFYWMAYTKLHIF